MASEWKIKMNGALKLFLWIIFPSLDHDENRAIGVFSREFWMWQIADLKQLPGLRKKLGIVHISSKLNSAFSTMGKATADKITAKLMGKTHAFAFAWLTNCSFEHAFMQRITSVKFRTFFVLLDKFFCLIYNWKFIVIELPVVFLSFGCLHLRVLVHAGFGFLYI